MTTKRTPAPRDIRHDKQQVRVIAGTAVALGLLVIVSFVAYILRNYYVKAYSDPINWLTYANNITEKFQTSKWPVGYPVFLWLVLKVVGPYYVFLSNMVVLGVLALLVAMTAWSAARQSEEALDSFLIALGCLALMFGFDSEVLVYLSNPYRDPLSFVLVMAAVLSVFRYVDSGGRRLVLLGLGGLLTGLAYCVRETSVLITAPLLIYGADAWRRNRDIGFWRSCLVFGLCMFAGALPLIVQAYLSTGQAVLPPQSVSSGTLLPGLHMSTQKSTLGTALSYFWGGGGWFYLAAAAAGVYFGLLQKCRKLSHFLIPGVLIFFVFYSFYEHFYSRYFYVVVVLLMPIAAYGVFKVVAVFLETAGLICFKTYAYLLLTAVLCLLVSVRLLSVKSKEPEFRISDAQKFVGDISKHFDPGAVVLCDRHLCEVIDYFFPVESKPCYEFCDQDELDPGQLFAGVGALLAVGTDLYVVSASRDEGLDAGAAMLDRMYALEPIGKFDTSQYNLQARITSYRKARIFRVGRWRQNAVTHQVDIPEDDNPVLRIDAGWLWKDEARKYARLLLDGKVIDEHVENGAGYYRVHRSMAGRRVQLKLLSDRPVRPTIEPVVVSGTEPVCLDFGIEGGGTHAEYLSDDFFRFNASGSPRVRSLQGAGVVQIPVPWSHRDGCVYAEFVVRAVEKTSAGSLELLFRGPVDDVLRVYELPADGLGHPVAVPLMRPIDTKRYPVTVQIKKNVVRGREQDAEHLPDAIDLDRVIVRNLPYRETLTIPVGAPDDVPFIVWGFYGREKFEGRYHCRWTAARALLDIRTLRPSPAMKLEIQYVAGIRPSGAPAPMLRIRLNDTSLEPGSVRSPDKPGIVTVTCDIPEGSFGERDNLLLLECTPWSPADYGADDARQLGIMLHKVRMFSR